MNTRGLITRLLLACAVFPLLLCACQPVNASTSLPSLQPTATILPEQPPSGVSGDITLDLSGLALGRTVETVPAAPASAGGPVWDTAPQHRRVLLQGYPVINHQFKPQIFIYPAAELAAYNETAGGMAADLQALLLTQQAGDALPFLPLFNAKQVMHPQVQYLDFKNGKGVRFLTWFSQGMMMINNVELIYTFQGLTSDGKYYVAAILPVTHPDLPAAQQASTQAGADYRNYITKTTAWLEQQPSGSFTPDLAKLDALIQSIEVK